MVGWCDVHMPGLDHAVVLCPGHGQSGAALEDLDQAPRALRRDVDHSEQRRVEIAGKTLDEHAQRLHGASRSTRHDDVLPQSPPLSMTSRVAAALPRMDNYAFLDSNMRLRYEAVQCA